ncbi:hypothetical protein X777_07470 [Ooceraea biroi]|uniref:Uncharacterized protein n=1 Tax=Ooceraea biroi TaxID=2015173 RepID=A0A026X305_OOCBI|nr:hypothetical protein X777_07470 [Ooceraea biroi]
MADESQQSQEPTSKRRKILSHLPIAIKVLEVAMAIFAIGLAVDPMDSFQHVFTRSRFKLADAATIYITVAGYILINTLFILSHMLGDRVPKRTTPKTVTKETPIQTLSKCEFCERQMQPFASPIGGAPPVQCLQHSPQWTPAIVQFVRGGVSIPCCPGCKCMTRGTQQHQSQQVVPEHRTKWVSQMLQPKTSEATQQVASKSDVISIISKSQSFARIGSLVQKRIPSWF